MSRASCYVKERESRSRESERNNSRKMSDDEKKSSDHHHHHDDHGHHHHQQYGTFGGGPPVYPPQPPAMGFPQPVPPPGVAAAAGHPPPYPAAPAYYAHGYQAVAGYATVAEGRPLREPRLPCCGLGMGWFLFIAGFFFVAIPWYVAAFILMCATRVDHREKPGYVACTIAAIIAAIAVIFGATKGTDVW